VEHLGEGGILDLTYLVVAERARAFAQDRGRTLAFGHIGPLTAVLGY
jgi:hypothetical protein